MSERSRNSTTAVTPQYVTLQGADRNEPLMLIRDAARGIASDITTSHYSREAGALAHGRRAERILESLSRAGRAG